MLRGIHSPTATLGASLQEAAGAATELPYTHGTAQECGEECSPHTSCHSWAGTPPLGCWRQGSSASREAMAPCPAAALQPSDRRQPALIFLTGLYVWTSIYTFFFHLFHRLFLESGSLWVSNNIKSVLLMIPQVLLEGSTESRSDLVSFYFILEAPWGIQKACENPKTKRERKEKNPLTKKSICIWVPPKYVCQLHGAAHWDDISSVILWLTELHKLFASL